MSKREYDVVVENIVASVTFGIRIPLDDVASASENVEYEPEQFPGAVFRIPNMPTTALIFSSGKIICTGAKDMETLEQCVDKVIKLLKSANVKVGRDYELKIENIVSSAKLPYRIDLDKLALNLETAEYEPEQFPGLVYKDEKNNVAFLIFNSGKIICTGGRKVSEIKGAFDELYSMLNKLKVFIKP